jgi:DNA end-binding protein Ku
MGTLLRYPYEVRCEEEYFDEIQDVKVTKDMLDLAKHIVNQKSGRFEPKSSRNETALVDLINQKRAGQADLAEGAAAWRERCRSDGRAAQERRQRHSGYHGSEERRQETTEGRGRAEVLMPIAGKKQAKETAAKKPAARSQRKSA